MMLSLLVTGDKTRLINLLLLDVVGAVKG